jgi:hypothetical protein
MSTNGALGPEASKFLSVVFKHVKAAGMFSMRHSHQDTDSTWNTTWFSTFWRQRISSAATATNAAFVNPSYSWIMFFNIIALLLPRRHRTLVSTTTTPS